MKLHTADQHPVERIGNTGAESQFTITSNAQAFEILSAGIYTDPIAAVIRELSCNAYDAQVEAGKGDDQFIIHLPTALEPFFSVTDNGIGLSDEDIRGLYSSYFQSTKTNTNDQIGAFGLGSKSPFSYSKAFDVVSRFDGEKRTYTVFVNEDGVPTIQELAKMNTKEHNGIEVKIAVRQQDYHTFITKTATVLRFFPIKPKIIGVHEFEFDQMPDDTIVTDTYAINRHGSGITAVQGNVPYNVNTYQISDYMSSSCKNFADRNRVVMFFDIGSLDIAANREEVRYDEQTAQNIADALQVAFDDYLVQLDDKITELTRAGSVWDIYVLLRDKFGSGSSLRSLVGNTYKFTSDVANDWTKNDQLKFDPNWKYHKILPYGHGDLRAVRRGHNFEGYGDDRKYLISPRISIQVVIQDCTKRGSMRMNTVLEPGYHSSGITTLMAIIPITDRALKNTNMTATDKERAVELKEIITQLGNPEVKLISTWTNDVTQSSGGGRTSGHTFKQFAPNLAGKKASKPHFQVAHPTNGGLYLEIDQLRNIMIKGEKTSMGSKTLALMLVPVLNVINLAQGTDYKPSDVYGLTKKVVKHISTNNDWTYLPDAYADAIVDQTDIIEYYRRIGNSTTLNLGNVVTEDYFVNMVKSLDTSSHFRSIVEPVIEKSQAATDLARHADHSVDKVDFRDHLTAFNNYFGFDIKVSTDSFFNDGDLDDYFMLRHLSLSYMGDCRDARRYIELVES